MEGRISLLKKKTVDFWLRHLVGNNINYNVFILNIYNSIILTTYDRVFPKLSSEYVGFQRSILYDLGNDILYVSIYDTGFPGSMVASEVLNLLYNLF